jgi:hypothetical protein
MTSASFGSASPTQERVIMADIDLNNPGIQNDIGLMVQATKDMDAAIDDFVQIARNNLGLLSGENKDAISLKLDGLSRTSASMAGNFGDGTKILDSMIASINHGDVRGAQHINS